jgi:probable HAF family extracellular repeat protein
VDQQEPGVGQRAIRAQNLADVSFATLAEAQTVSASWPHYAVINLGTLGGSQSNGYGGPTNNGEQVSGDAYLPGSLTEHAALWRRDDMGRFVVTYLGTLGGLNSSTGFPQKNDIGLVVGGAQGSQIDPLGECWSVAYGCVNGSSLCEGYRNLEFGFRWQNGVMIKLPPIGGNNSEATGDNNLGQVVGLAETATKDPSSVAPQVLDYKAVVWGPRRARSTNCLRIRATPSRELSRRRHDICGSLAERRDHQPWRAPRDVMSVANDINAQGQVVGVSCDANFNCRAFLWDKGVMMDLNSLIPPDSPVYLTYGGGINDRGEIAGTAVPKNNPNATTAFLAIPAPAAQIAGDSVPKITLPETVRASLQRRLRLGRPTARQ